MFQKIDNTNDINTKEALVASHYPDYKVVSFNGENYDGRTKLQSINLEKIRKSLGLHKKFSSSIRRPTLSSIREVYEGGTRRKRRRKRRTRKYRL